ncbi:MAG: phosphate ABC transporter permease PstA [Thermoleophilia bacterium]
MSAVDGEGDVVVTPDAPGEEPTVEGAKASPLERRAAGEGPPVAPPPPAPPADLPSVQPKALTHGRLPTWGPWAVYGVAAVIGIVLIFAMDTNIVLAALMCAAGAGIVTYAWSRAVEGGRHATDRVVTLAVVSAFAVAAAPLVSVLYTVIDEGRHRFDADFFTETMRSVVGPGGGAYHAIIGTLVITGLATLFSVPVGIMCAVYLNEYGRGKLKAAIIFFVDVMTGIPSIVAGLFAFALFSIFLGPGVRLGIAAAIALSVLMIPIVVRSTEEMLKVVPNGLRESSYALGVPKWRTITKVVLPTSMAGIITGVMVAVARVMGETAPLLITSGTLDSLNWNPFHGRMESLPVFAFDQYRNPGVQRDAYTERVWAAVLVLVTIVMALNLIARLIYRRFGGKAAADR